jgi:AraC family transcriptional regulator
MQPKEAPASQIQPSRFEDSKPLRIAGLKQRLSNETMKDISALWQRFIPHFGKVPGQVGNIAYGLCSKLEMKPFSFDYLAGVEVSGNLKLPEGFSHVDIPALRYAVFPHHDHVVRALRRRLQSANRNWRHRNLDSVASVIFPSPRFVSSAWTCFRYAVSVKEQGVLL